VAQLAGVSIEYYTRLARGNLSGVSKAVLDSLVVALPLDESERAYLFDLAKAASAPSTSGHPVSRQSGPAGQLGRNKRRGRAGGERERPLTAKRPTIPRGGEHRQR
jgi:hypothetical protein